MTQGLHHWFVLGAGAMGCLFAQRLASAGYDVTLLVRDKTLASYYAASEGLQIQEQEYTYHEQRCKVKSVDALNIPIHQLILATKAPDVLASLERVKPHLTAEALIVLLQNGMGVDEQCHQAYPHLYFINAPTTSGAYRLGPFHICISHIGDMWLGQVFGPALGVQQQRQLVQALKVCGLPCQWQDNIRPILWRKLAVNCAINPLSALYACRNGELVQHEARKQHMRKLCYEISEVLAALDLAISGHSLYRQVLKVARDTAQNYSSMYQDIHKNRPTEIDFINGFVVQTAGKLGINVPSNAAVYQAILQKQAEPMP